MATKLTLGVNENTRVRVRSESGTSEQCILGFVGILVGLVAIMNGVVAMSAISSVATVESAGQYWSVAAWGIWVPAIAITGSILGAVSGMRFALPIVWASPVLSISGYVIYNYPQIQSYMEKLCASFT